MTVSRADFYLLKQDSAERLLQTACRLAARAVAGGQTLFIQTADAAQTEALDEWLWSFPAESFLPHLRTDDARSSSAPVLVGQKLTTTARDICLNVSGKPVEQPARYQRILELFAPDDVSRQAARLRWQHYKQLGFSLDHHEV
jgi:DNA polymerase-3 subunit chi